MQQLHMNVCCRSASAARWNSLLRSKSFPRIIQLRGKLRARIPKPTMKQHPYPIFLCGALEGPARKNPHDLTHCHLKGSAQCGLSDSQSNRVPRPIAAAAEI